MISSKRKIAAVLGLIILFPAREGLARQETSRVTLRTGMISNSSADPRQYAPYPELEVSTRFKTGSAWSMSGGAYAGYSWDSIDDRCAHCRPHSMRALAVGMRLMFTMERTAIPIDWIVGATKHYTFRKNSGQQSESSWSNDSFTAFEFGLQARYPLATRWQALGGGSALLSDFVDSTLGDQSFRFNFFLGTSYAF